MGKGRGTFRVLVGKPEGRKPLQHPGVNGMVILKWIFETWDGEAWTESI